MKKKFLTRRGFTIVEVLVAFVIFAIMAGMVGMILSSTMRAKQQNIDIEEEISEQQNVYYGKTQEKVFDSSSTEKLTFNFSGVDPVEIDYSIGDPNASDAGNEIALEYFVGDVDYSVMQGKTNNNNSTPEKAEGSIANRFDSTGIYASNGITSISLKMERDSSDTSVNRYLFVANVSGSSDPQYDYFKQFRLLFPYTITDYGYCLYVPTTKTFRDIKSVRSGGVSSTYEAVATTSNTIRIANKQTADPLINQGNIAFFVELSGELESKSSSLNLQDIFGYSDTAKTPHYDSTEGCYNFTRYAEDEVDKDGNKTGNVITHVNVFAAVEKTKTS